MKNAKWIKCPSDIGTVSPVFEKEIDAASAVKKASICVSAIGLYALYINGERIGDSVLCPGWSYYEDHVQYQKYDITEYMSAPSKISIAVGKGWASTRIGFDPETKYDDCMSVIAMIDIKYENGESKCIGTGSDWDVYTSKILFSEIYDGEIQDATAEIKYIGRATETHPAIKLIPQIGEYIKEHERVAAAEYIVTPLGERVIDFGQNMTGYVEVKAHGTRGKKITFTHAEVLDRNGNFYTDNMRSAKNRISYTLTGNEDIFKPLFTFQGFRYIRLDEYPSDDIDISLFTAISVNSDIRRTGDFTCGNEKINQLYHNIIWGQKSNYLDVPTDCPQRDERLGWTGDTQVFCRTGAINFDVEKFFRKWLLDLRTCQHENGAVPDVVPPRIGNKSSGTAAWGDAACVVPWEMYLAYGNKKDLAAAYPSMKRWIGYIRNSGDDEYIWNTDQRYGDWLAMDAGEDSYEGATPKYFIASAFYAYSLSLLIKAGEAIGEDVSEYLELYSRVRKAFREKYMKDGLPCLTSDSDPDKRIPITQTSLVLILKFGLCEDNERAAAAELLVKMISDNGGKMATGFVGTPYILHVLSENGYTDAAYKLLYQEENPSWLYAVNRGATTVWEHWNGIKEDGSFWSADMNSFNHYAYGCVFDWIFGVSAGIKPTEPAYKRFTFAPHPDRGLGFLNASLDSRSGMIIARWYYRGDEIHYELTVPKGAVADVALPGGYRAVLSGGSYLFREKA